MSITLSWHRRAPSGLTQRIYRSTAPFDSATLPTVLASLTNGETSYRDVDDFVSGTYYYMIEVVDGANSVYSQLVNVNYSVKQAALPSPGLTAYAVNDINPEFVSDFSGDIHFAAGVGSTFADNFTFARDGAATYFDSLGVLQTASDGVARTANHIWNGSTWEGPFLLLESQAATNLMRHSEAFDSAFWTVNSSGTGIDAVVTSNAGVAPDGTNTADQIVFDKGAGVTLSDFSLIQSSLLQTTSGLHTNSIWIKSPSGPVDLALRTIGTNSASPDYVVCNVTDVWQRFPLTTNQTSIATGMQLILRGTYGTSNAATVLVWGAQNERSPTVSSYIRTTTTAATRNAETLSISADDAPWSGTAVSIQMSGKFDYREDGTSSNITFIDWQAIAGTAAENRVQWRLDTSNSLTGSVLYLQADASAAASFVRSADIYNEGTNIDFNLASRHTAAAINGAVNGVASTASTDPTSLPDISANNVSIGLRFMGNVSIIRMWDEDIGDAGIVDATTV